MSGRRKAADRLHPWREFLMAQLSLPAAFPLPEISSLTRTIAICKNTINSTPQWYPKECQCPHLRLISVRNGEKSKHTCVEVVGHVDPSIIMVVIAVDANACLPSVAWFGFNMTGFLSSNRKWTTSDNPRYWKQPRHLNAELPAFREGEAFGFEATR